MASQRGAKWEGSVKVKGLRVRKTFERKEQALLFEQYPLDVIEVGDHGWKVKDETIFDRTLHGFCVKHFSMIWGQNADQAFAKRHLRNLCDTFGHTTLINDITTKTIDTAIQTWLASGLKPSSVNHRLSALSKILKYALRLDVITRSPHIERMITKNRRERIWSKSDEHRAFRFLDDINDRETKYILQFLLYTGARVGEAYQLTRESVANGWIHFDRKTTKTGRTREIPLAPKAEEAWRFLCQASSASRPLEVITVNVLRHRWKRLREYFRAQDDPDFVIHMLRHTCASRLVAARVPIAHVMLWMGHSSINSTLRYSHIAPREIEYMSAAL